MSLKHSDLVGGQNKMTNYDAYQTYIHVVLEAGKITSE